MGAEYFLKQSKLNFSVDSDFAVRSTLDAELAGIGQLQLCAEVQHAAETQFKIGYGLIFM